MAYQQLKKPKPKARRDMYKGAARGKLFLMNGNTATYAVPMFYVDEPEPNRVYPHSRRLHDHKGWPTPDRPDNSCQLPISHSPHGNCGPVRPYIDMSDDAYIPINLIEEGYHTVTCVFVDPPAGLQWEGYIEEDEFWVVKWRLHCDMDAAIEEPVVIPYQIKITRGSDTTPEDKPHTDTVSVGKLVILPIGWEEYDYEEEEE